MKNHLYNCKEYLKLTKNQTETPFIKKVKIGVVIVGVHININKYTVGKKIKLTSITSSKTKVLLTKCQRMTTTIKVVEKIFIFPFPIHHLL